MTETAPIRVLKPRETYPRDTQERASKDKNSSFAVNNYGGILMAMQLNTMQVLYPGPEEYKYKLRGVKNPDLTKLYKELANLTDPQAIADKKEEIKRTKIIGKTNAPGKSWWAFPWGYRQARARKKARGVHGVTSNAATHYKTIKTEDGSVHLQTGGPDSKIFKDYFSLEDEVYTDIYTIDRQFSLDETLERHTAHIKTTVKNSGENEVDPPPGSEHFFAIGDENSAFLRPDGTTIKVTDFVNPDSHGTNVTDNDVTMDDIGYGDKIVYLPFGESSPVIVFQATLTTPHGAQPLQTFHLYKAQKDSPFTAVEPIVEGLHLAQDQAYTLDFSVTTYTSREAFQAAQHN